MPLKHFGAALLMTGLLLATAVRADETTEVQRLMAQGLLPAALQRAQAAIKITPNDARLRFAHALLLFDMQRDADAMQAFFAMSQDFPQLPEPHNNMAALHARAGQWELARVALETALRNDSRYGLARENLGDVHLQLALQAWRQTAAQFVLGPELQRKIRLAAQLTGSTLFEAKGPAKDQ